MQKERKMVYEIRRFEKTYTKGMSKKDLLYYDFRSDKVKLLVSTKSIEKATSYFEKIKIEKKILKNGEVFRFYFFDKVKYDEKGEVIDSELISFKEDEIKE